MSAKKKTSLLDVNPKIAGHVAEIVDSFSDVLIDPRAWFNATAHIVRGAGADRASEAARQLAEPEYYHPHLSTLMSVFWEFRGDMEPAAVATVFRAFSNRLGIYAPTHNEQTEIAAMLRWIREQAEVYLMTPDEISWLKSLPGDVEVYRGQPSERHPGSLGITGMSWTLSRQVADQYTFSHPAANGWLITGVAPKRDVLMAVLEWDEREVVIDPARVQVKLVERGKATKHPARFDRPRTIGRFGKTGVTLN